ncbi:pentatricopeptide repeat-containing protein At3g23020 [Andrographis paniculata]|uniref:pentatricopeptide repeat-containing protein At3g23020 n=1 Tax=Andrographis paniculata TaxID=175694 RepID=UPI0021E799EF|nr:pentatricopeptide repeat-containing protein At3g23020 [Andrographis paniculata]
MLVNLQHSDSNCIGIFNSAKATPPPRVGVLIAPPPKSKPNHKKQVLRFPNGRRISERSDDSVRCPLGSPEKINNGFSPTKNGVLEQAPDCNFYQNSDSRRKKATQISSGKKSTRKTFQSIGERNSAGEVEKVHTKCSTKWLKYGGSIPAMLAAVETVEDLDEALKPWEMTLTNKERSILLKEQRNWEKALSIFEWFKGKECYELNVIHYNIMLRILGRARQWPELERFCGEMVKKGIEPINSTYGTLIDSYSKGGLPEKAMECLNLMNRSEMEPDEVTMGIIVQMYKTAGNFEMAEEFFKNWRIGAVREGRNAASIDGFCLSAYTYNTLIDTYGKGGKVLQASETFERMVRSGVSPTTVTFNTMIHMYGNNGELDKVASLMERMKAAKCAPDTRTYNILISLHAKHDNIETAARYLAEMKELSLEPDVVTYRTLLYAFSIRQMVAEAEELISEIETKGMAIDEFTQSSLTRMYIEAGMLETALSWFERFHRRGGMTPDCYSANVDAFGERGYVFEAEKVFESCLESGNFTVVEFNVMIKAYGVGKKFEQACGLFDSMEKHGLSPDRCGYNSLVQMLAGADLPSNALFYLRRMQESGLVDDCVPYCAVISSYVKIGDIDEAVGLYNEMIRNSVKPDIVVYGVLINAFADTGNVEEAMHYVNAMTSHGLARNAVICKSLIKLYTKVGYLTEAREAYDALHLLETGLDVYSSNCMIDLYGERSMVSEAEAILEKLTVHGGGNEFAYAMMLCMYKRNGMFVEAFRVARKMRELGFMTDVLSYNHVLGLYASDGRYKEATETFREMMEARVRPDESTFRSIGVILLKCGMPKSAVDMLDVVRRKDAENGLRAWASTLSAVVEMGG